MMEIIDNTLHISKDLTDDMVEGFLEVANSQDVKIIKIESSVITSAIMQALFCLSKTKKIELADSSLQKFFENIEFVK